MNVPLATTLHIDHTAYDSSGTVASVPDNEPAVKVFEDATDTPLGGTVPTTMTARGGAAGLTNGYRVAIPCTAANGFEAGKTYNVVATWTIFFTQFQQTIATFRIVAADPAVAADVPAASAVAGAVLDESVFTGFSVRKILKGVAAALFGNVTEAGSSYKIPGTATEGINATTGAGGNRTVDTTGLN